MKRSSAASKSEKQRWKPVLKRSAVSWSSGAGLLGHRIVLSCVAGGLRRQGRQHLELAAQLPVSVLAISAGTAIRWTQASGGEWANYAAVRSRTAN